MQKHSYLDYDTYAGELIKVKQDILDSIGIEKSGTGVPSDVLI